jgi:hypothetical protein
MLVKGALGDCVTVWYFKARGDAFLGANKALGWPGIAAGILEKKGRRTSKW